MVRLGLLPSCYKNDGKEEPGAKDGSLHGGITYGGIAMQHGVGAVTGNQYACELVDQHLLHTLSGISSYSVAVRFGGIQQILTSSVAMFDSFCTNPINCISGLKTYYRHCFLRAVFGTSIK